MPVDDERVDRIIAAATAVYEDAEIAVVRYVTARLARGLDAADWQTKRLSEIGQLRAGLRAITARLAGTAGPATRAAVTAGWRAGTETAITDLAMHAPVPAKYPKAVQALADALVSELRPLHSQILPHAESAYRNAIGAATGRKVTGVASTRRAAQAAWAALVNDGITGFTDKSGRRWQLSTYVEMATRTAVARAIDVGVTDLALKEGGGLVYVTVRPQECKLCRPWEGRVLSVTAPPRKPARNTVGDARRAGLGHPNCRHQLAVWTPKTRVPTAKPDPVGEAARAHQRYLERQLRHWRTREAAALSPEGRRDAQNKIGVWNTALLRHLQQHGGLRRMQHREHPGAGYAAPKTRRGDTARHPR